MPRGSGLKIKRERTGGGREGEEEEKKKRGIVGGGGGGGGGEASRPVKKQPNRRGQSKPAASRVRRAFQSGVRMQSYSTAHRKE